MLGDGGGEIPLNPTPTPSLPPLGTYDNELYLGLQTIKRNELIFKASSMFLSIKLKTKNNYNMVPRKFAAKRDKSAHGGTQKFLDGGDRP